MAFGACTRDAGPPDREQVAGINDSNRQGEHDRPEADEGSGDEPQESRPGPSGPVILPAVLRVRVGRQPKQVSFTPSGDLLVTLLKDDGVDLVRLTDGSVRRLSVPAYGQYEGFVESVSDPHRDRLLVSQMTTGQVHSFTRDGSHVNSFSTHGSWSKVLALSPDGSIMAISNWLSDTVTVVDATSGELQATITVPGAETPRGLAFAPDGASLLIAWFGSGKLTSHTTDSWQLRHQRDVGGAPRHLVVDRGGDLVYLSNMATRQVHAFQVGTLERIGTARVGSNPNTIALSPDGTFLFVSCRGPNNPAGYELPAPEPGSIHVISTTDLRTVQVIEAGRQPTGLAVSPDGRYLAATNFQDDELVVYRLAPREKLVADTIPVQ